MSKGELELSGLSGARLVCPGPASGVKSRFQSPGCLADDRWPQPVCGVGTALRGCWAGAGKTSLAGGLPSWREEMGPPGPFTCCPCPGPTHEGILASASPSPLPSEGATRAFLVGTLQRQEGHWQLLPCLRPGMLMFQGVWRRRLWPPPRGPLPSGGRAVWSSAGHPPAAQLSVPFPSVRSEHPGPAFRGVGGGWGSGNPRCALSVCLISWANSRFFTRLPKPRVARRRVAEIALTSVFAAPSDGGARAKRRRAVRGDGSGWRPLTPRIAPCQGAGPGPHTPGSSVSRAFLVGAPVGAPDRGLRARHTPRSSREGKATEAARVSCRWMTPTSPGRCLRHHFQPLQAGAGIVYRPSEAVSRALRPACSGVFGKQGAGPRGDSGPPAGSLALSGWQPQAGWPWGTVSTVLCWQDLVFCFIFIFVSSSPSLFRLCVDTACGLPQPSFRALETHTRLRFQPSRWARGQRARAERRQRRAELRRRRPWPSAVTRPGPGRRAQAGVRAPDPCTGRGGGAQPGPGGTLPPGPGTSSPCQRRWVPHRPAGRRPGGTERPLFLAAVTSPFGSIMQPNSCYYV